VTEKPLNEIGEAGLFTKELEQVRVLLALLPNSACCVLLALLPNSACCVLLALLPNSACCVLLLLLTLCPCRCPRRRCWRAASTCW